MRVVTTQHQPICNSADKEVQVFNNQIRKLLIKI